VGKAAEGRFRYADVAIPQLADRCELTASLYRRPERFCVVPPQAMDKAQP
jgi:hypothetical protein